MEEQRWKDRLTTWLPWIWVKLALLPHLDLRDVSPHLPKRHWWIGKKKSERDWREWVADWVGDMVLNKRALLSPNVRVLSLDDDSLLFNTVPYAINLNPPIVFGETEALALWVVPSTYRTLTTKGAIGIPFGLDCNPNPFIPSIVWLLIPPVSVDILMSVSECGVGKERRWGGEKERNLEIMAKMLDASDHNYDFLNFLQVFGAVFNHL